jgi:hypothetical protein
MNFTTRYAGNHLYKITICPPLHVTELKEMPIIKMATPMPGLAHVINDNATSDISGTIIPIEPNTFLVFVRDIFPLEIILSLTTLVTTVIKQLAM